MKSGMVVLGCVLALAFVVVGRGQIGMMGGGSLRHRFVMRNGVDPAYARLRNPLTTSDANAAAGGVLDGKYCAGCHGAGGLGDGGSGERPQSAAS